MVAEDRELESLLFGGAGTAAPAGRRRSGSCSNASASGKEAVEGGSLQEGEGEGEEGPLMTLTQASASATLGLVAALVQPEPQAEQQVEQQQAAPMEVQEEEEPGVADVAAAVGKVVEPVAPLSEQPQQEEVMAGDEAQAAVAAPEPQPPGLQEQQQQAQQPAGARAGVGGRPSLASFASCASSLHLPTYEEEEEGEEEGGDDHASLASGTDLGSVVSTGTGTGTQQPKKKRKAGAKGSLTKRTRRQRRSISGVFLRRGSQQGMLDEEDEEGEGGQGSEGEEEDGGAARGGGEGKHRNERDTSVLTAVSEEREDASCLLDTSGMATVAAPAVRVGCLVCGSVVIGHRSTD